MSPNGESVTHPSRVTLLTTKIVSMFPTAHYVHLLKMQIESFFFMSQISKHPMSWCHAFTRCKPSTFEKSELLQAVHFVADSMVVCPVVKRDIVAAGQVVFGHPQQNGHRVSAYECELPFEGSKISISERVSIGILQVEGFHWKESAFI